MKYEKPSTFVDLFDGLFNDNYITKSTYSSLKYDVINDDKNYLLELSLPGFKKEDVNINVENDVLTIKGERKKNDKLNYQYNGTFFGEFEKSFDLPEDILNDKIEASFNNGILSISIPKNEKARVSKMIKIN